MFHAHVIESIHLLWLAAESWIIMAETNELPLVAQTCTAEYESLLKDWKKDNKIFW